MTAPLAVEPDVDTGSLILYYVHADHLDTPVRMTDGSKSVVWDAFFLPFGTVESITGSASNNLRFPGQYFLIESGLHYNWYRHYDPTIGRYIQPDPLGFVGGPSIYAYVGGNPVAWIDVLGLEIIKGVPSGAVTFMTPNGECFYAPPWVDWYLINSTGASSGLSGAAENIGQGGAFDLQRYGGDVYPAYANAANYAVGVYMNGAGFSWRTTVIIGQTYGFFRSSNFGNNNWLDWWRNGWDAANNGLLPKNPTKCECVPSKN